MNVSVDEGINRKNAAPNSLKNGETTGFSAQTTAAAVSMPTMAWKTYPPQNTALFNGRNNISGAALSPQKMSVMRVKCNTSPNG